ncbi:hypothetical protein ANO11243_070100 [Dothideomycetidae sp. 11243]|nr:hypothetical protein ANO11243_070100 [fungal sp. No.11243]
MVTIGLAESLAIASLILETEEVIERVVEAVKRWRAYGKNAEALCLKFTHEQRRFKALQNFLTKTGKVVAGRCLYELMRAEQQHDVEDLLLHVFELVSKFEDLSKSYELGRKDQEQRDNVELPVSTLDTVSLENSLSALRERRRKRQASLGWYQKTKWTLKGQSNALTLVGRLREWLCLITEEIKLSIWEISSNDEGPAAAAQFPALEADEDVDALGLRQTFRVRNLAIYLQSGSTETVAPFQDNLWLAGALQAADNFGTERRKKGTWITKSDPGLKILVEFKSFENNDAPPDAPTGASPVERHMKNLCAFLAAAKDESFRLPLAKGLFKDDAKNEYGIVFPIESCGAQDLDSMFTLDTFFQSGKSREVAQFGSIVLERRLHLALSIATAIAKYHSVGWYHEGIESRNVCLVRDHPPNEIFKRPVLLGFTKSRTAKGESVGIADKTSMIYQHPDRARSHAAVRFTASHDLYSLGVLLLEIGRWKSASDIVTERLARESIRFSEAEPRKVSKKLLEYAETGLATFIGTRYQEVVVMLLSADPADKKGLSSQNRLLKVVEMLSDMSAAMSSSQESAATSPLQTTQGQAN